MTKGLIKPAVLTMVLVAGAYLLSVFFIGRQVQSELDGFAQEMTARSDVGVTRFEYERGFLGGTLHYDLLLTPEPDTTLPQLAALIALMPEEGLRVNGSVDVRHGPALAMPFSGNDSIGLARAEWSLPWPGELREMLSPAAASQTMLSMVSVIRLSGQLQANVKLSDYVGDVSDPETGETLTTDIQGVVLELVANRNFDQIDLRMSIARLMVAGEGRDTGRVDIQYLSLSGDWQQYSPYFWIGESDFSAELFALQSPGAVIAMNDVEIHTNTGVAQGSLQMSNTITAGRLVINDFDAENLEFIISAGNVDAEAYTALMTAGNQTESDTVDLSASLEQLLVTEPWFAIDSWRVSILAPDDITGNMRVQLPAVATIDEALSGLKLDNELRVSTSALRRFLRVYLQGVSEFPLEEPELTEETNRFYDNTLEMLASVPGLEVDSEYITMSAEIREGTLLVSGQPVMDVSPWLNSRILMGDPGRDSGNTALDTLAEPYSGRVDLQSGFSPDPFRLELIAGGVADLTRAPLAGSINGDCVGYVSAERPDMALNYSAVSGLLSIYTDSEADTTIIVRDPAGNWHCNDDAPGLAYNAGIIFDQPASGDYLIWVGTYAQSFAEATLLVSGQSPAEQSF